MLKDKELKEYNGIKIDTNQNRGKDFKYFTISREFGIHPLTQGEDFYMFHFFELDQNYGWNTFKITRIQSRNSKK
tara:strand:+ start:455 stop:679 length:225 start_codon:yes stop_codon:yes gene_type:complete